MQRSALIAGAGIGGLAAALALARSGWRVRVKERAERIEEVGAGVQMSPNATLLLRQWGILGAVEAAACRPEAVLVRRGSDGAVLSRMALGDVAERRWGAPSLTVHRADLQGALLEAVRACSAVTLELGQAKTDLDLEGADVLIGADGLRSGVRAALEVAGPLQFTHQVAWRALVPMDRVPAALRGLETGLWLGPKAHLVHYPLRGGSVLNVVALTEVESPGAVGNGWSELADPAALLQAFGAWHQNAQDLLRAAQDWRLWALYDRSPARRWGRGAVTLLGDAAHPMLPFLAQGAAMAIEDAASLARHLARADVIAGLRAYEAERQPRTARVQLGAREQARLYHLSGFMALARDTAMRMMGPERLLARYDWIYRG